MTDDRELSLVLDRWFEDGPTEMPDRVIDVTAKRIARQRQQLAWRLDWRHFTMNPLAKAGAAIAAVVVIALVGYNLLPGSSGFGPAPAPTFSTSPSPTPSPTASPTPSASPRTARMLVQGESVSWTATIPAGWSDKDEWYLTPSQGTTGPTGIAVASLGAVNVPSDPCDGVGKDSTGASVADVVAALEARHDLVVSNAIDTTLGGYSGTRVDVQMSSDLSICKDLYILFAEPDGGGIHAQGPSNLFRLWILDVAGRPIVFFVESFAGTPPDDAAAAQQIVDSIVITP
jgi:hypothetical protein